MQHYGTKFPANNWPILFQAPGLDAKRRKRAFFIAVFSNNLAEIIGYCSS